MDKCHPDASRKGYYMKLETVPKSSELASCIKILVDCVKFEHIENAEYILRSLTLVKDYKELISEEAYKEVEGVVEEYIKPLVYDFDYFQFLCRPEFGTRNEEGHFVINSDSALETMIFLLYEHALNLQEVIQKRFNKFMK